MSAPELKERFRSFDGIASTGCPSIDTIRRSTTA